MFTNGEFSIMMDYSTLQQELEQPTNSNTLGNSGSTIEKTNLWTDRIAVSYSQPLFQPNNQKMDIQRNERNFSLAEKSYTDIENDVWLEVLTQFYQLINAKRSLAIQQENLENTRTNYLNSVEMLRAGIIAEVDKMQWEVTLADARTQVYSHELFYKRLKDNFKKYIGLDLKTEIDPVAEIEVTFVDIDDNKAFDQALQHNVGLLESEYNLLTQRDNLELTIAQNRIRATLNLSYGLNEQDDFERFFRGEIGQFSADRTSRTGGLFQDFSQTTGVLLNLEVPIFDSGRRKTRIGSELEAIKYNEKNLEDQRLLLRVQTQTMLDEIENAKERIAITSINIPVSEEQYRISKQRFDIGDIDSDNLFNANLRLATAKLNALSAQIDYLLSLARLYQLTFWDFENDRPLNDTVNSYILQW